MFQPWKFCHVQNKTFVFETLYNYNLLLSCISVTRNARHHFWHHGMMPYLSLFEGSIETTEINSWL